MRASQSVAIVALACIAALLAPQTTIDAQRGEVATYTTRGAMAEAYRVHSWQVAAIRHDRAPSGRVTVDTRLAQPCWQVVITDGTRREEWRDPECARLAPVAGIYGTGATGIRIQWQAPHGYNLACFVRVRGGQLLGCTRAQTWQQGPGSVDASMRLVPGDVVEVRAYDETGAYIATRVAYGALWLPMLRTPIRTP